MRPYRERRLKLFEISAELSPDKYSIIAMFRELPKDAKLIRVAEAVTYGTMQFIFFSSEWPLVAEWEQLPRLDITIDPSMVAAAEKADGGEMEAYGRAVAQAVQSRRQSSHPGQVPAKDCNCDVDYTGGHRFECVKKNLRR
jgi:hypothetical protein